jgi:hypothetical protein
MHQTLACSWRHRACGLAAFALLLGGCGGGTVFALKDPAYSVTPTSVSVITGGSEEADLKLAEYLTKEFAEKTHMPK